MSVFAIYSSCDNIAQVNQADWLLLLHQIPPTPPYFRAKVLRRLNQLGAMAIKNSVYILPDMAETREDLEWVRSEILQEGGEAWLFRAQTLAGLSNEQLQESFRVMRSCDYKQLLDSTKAIADSQQYQKLRRRFEEVRKIDFFDAPEREELETIMETIDRKLHKPAAQPAPKPDLKNLNGRTWVTRRGVKVDRISTAWLVRRFIDPAARFVFVDQDHYTHAGDEIRFDMFEGEFTHEGDLCTFESVVRHMQAHDPALSALAEIVHDIDLKDEKYQRPETNGIAAMISGITTLHSADDRRIDEGSRLLEAAYAALKTVRKA